MFSDLCFHLWIHGFLNKCICMFIFQWAIFSFYSKVLGLFESFLPAFINVCVIEQCVCACWSWPASLTNRRASHFKEEKGFVTQACLLIFCLLLIRKLKEIFCLKFEIFCLYFCTVNQKDLLIGKERRRAGETGVLDQVSLPTAPFPNAPSSEGWGRPQSGAQCPRGSMADTSCLTGNVCLGRTLECVMDQNSNSDTLMGNMSIPPAVLAAGLNFYPCFSLSDTITNFMLKC